MAESSTIKTITALYQQPIGSNFPMVDSNGAYSESRWEPQNGSTYSQVLVYIDVMPDENVTFRRNTSNNSVKYMEFYVEALPGQTPDRTFDGRSFVKYGETIPARYGYFTEAEDFVDLIGYEKFGSDPAFVNGQANPGNGGTIRFYYTRVSYDITFLNGSYYDGYYNLQTTAPSTDLGGVEGISYGADISSYNVDGDDYYTPAAEQKGFVFAGWCSDETCTSEY